MKYARLEDHAPQVDALARSILGFTIKYVTAGRTLSIQAQGDLADGQLAGVASVAIAQEVELMILKLDLPAKPVSADRITLLQRPADLWQPVNVSNDETGRHWVFNLKRVAV